jgi:hypothetical protein
MGVTIRGERELLRELERRIGERAATRISDKALLAGAAIFVHELKIQLATFRDKGFTIDEVTISEPMFLGTTRVIKVHWRGPHDRYRVIHLNENGTVRIPNPPGKGKIRRALRNSEDLYRMAIKRAIEEAL